jgi:hypothetical protein
VAGREEVVSRRKKISDKVKLAAALLASTSSIHRRALAGPILDLRRRPGGDRTRRLAGPRLEAQGALARAEDRGKGPGSICGKSAAGR